MASQITHVPYGKIVLDRFLSDQKVNEEKFFIGTLFPDIRVLGRIERDSTHTPHPTIETLRQIEGDFEKGVYTHSLVDVERERILNKFGIYDLIGINRIVWLAMKVIEDFYTYRMVQDWSRYIGFMDHIQPEETKLVSPEIALKWHGLLKRYFAQEPDRDSRKAFVDSLGVDAPYEFELVEAEIHKIRSNDRALEIIKNTHKYLFK